ncbi:hypothetical protein BU17DRAFT_79861 [Hysterangium stoloniferum]|nr:hypothetical protein BU17DRAFT_79861 [Hysterangium stoloniferum]
MDQQPPSFSESPIQNGLDSEHDLPLYINNVANDELWHRWATSDRANQRIMELESALAELESKLQSQTKEIERSKQKSSNIFSQLCGTPVRTQSFIRLDVVSVVKRVRSQSESNPRERLQREFYSAIEAETAAMRQLDTLRDTAESLRAQIQSNSFTASEADQLFEILKATVAHYTPNGPSHTRILEDDLVRLQASYDKAQKVLTDLERARITVQHAHHYYSMTLKKLDDVRGVAFSWGGAVTKIKYQAAVEIAIKADTCLKETIRVLEPHLSTIPKAVLVDFEELQTMGLLQASEIYTLMYGAERDAPGVSKTIKLLFQDQETAFVSLTRLAIWVQERVPFVAADLRMARAGRDGGRRNLIIAWKAQVQMGTDGLPNFDSATATTEPTSYG